MIRYIAGFIFGLATAALILPETAGEMLFIFMAILAGIKAAERLLEKERRQKPMTEMDLQHPDITRIEQFGTLHDEETIYKCDNCACEIYEGESFYDIGGDIYCVDCIKECCHTA